VWRSQLPLHATPTQNGVISPAAQTDHQHYRHRASHIAIRILDQVEQAKQSLAANQLQSAAQHVNQALTYRDQLAALPHTTGGPVIVPIYWEFDDTSVLGRTLAARKDGKPQPAKSAPITVDAAGTQYTFVGLDLAKVRTRLDNAKSALSSNDPQAAAASLSRIGDELIVMKVQAEYPLLATRENLGLAEIAISNGRYTEAAAALKEASVTLGQYASSQAAHRPFEAKNLSKQIDSLSQTIEKNHTGASARIDAWWNHVNAWFTHPIKD
jgi:hypothetical protein